MRAWAENRTKRSRRRMCLQFCWGTQWRYSCIVCLQSGSILHICRRTHRVVYRRCWWEPRTPCPRRHTLPWACTESSSTPTLYLHTHRKSDHHHSHATGLLFLSCCTHGQQCTVAKTQPRCADRSHSKQCLWYQQMKCVVLKVSYVDWWWFGSVSAFLSSLWKCFNFQFA